MAISLANYRLCPVTWPLGPCNLVRRALSHGGAVDATAGHVVQSPCFAAAPLPLAPLAVPLAAVAFEPVVAYEMTSSAAPTEVKYGYAAIGLMTGTDPAVAAITPHVLPGTSGKLARTQLFVTTLAGKSIAVSTEAEDTIEHLKGVLQDATGIPPHLQRLTFQGHELAGTIGAAGLCAGDTVRMTARLHGGQRRKRQQSQEQWPLPQSAKRAATSATCSSMPSSAAAMEVKRLQKQVAALEKAMAGTARPSADKAPPLRSPPAETQPTPPPRPRTIANAADACDVDGDMQEPDDEAKVVTLSPLDRAGLGSDVPSMVEAPLSTAERHELTQQLKAAETGLEALKDIPGLEPQREAIQSHILGLRNRLHRAKPLSERRTALVAARDRRAAQRDQALQDEAAAKMALAAARETATAAEASLEAMNGELAKLDDLIAAEVAADPSSAAGEQAVDPLELLRQAFAAHASGGALDSAWWHKASTVIEAVAPVANKPVTKPGESPRPFACARVDVSPFTQKGPPSVESPSICSSPLMGADATPPFAPAKQGGPERSAPF